MSIVGFFHFEQDDHDFIWFGTNGMLACTVLLMNRIINLTSILINDSYSIGVTRVNCTYLTVKK